MSANPPEEAHSQLKQISNNAPSPVPQPPTTTAPSAGKARLQCHACNRLLEYDAGAQYVQCFSCSTMNAVQAGTQIGGRVLSMLCAICHTTNLAPYGINYVRCGSCSTISQVTHAYRGQPERVAPQQPPTQEPQPGPMAPNQPPQPNQQETRQASANDFQQQSTPQFDDISSQQQATTDEPQGANLTQLQ